MRIGTEGGALHDALTCSISLSGIDLHVAHADVVAMAQSGSTLLPGDAFRLFSRDPLLKLDGVACHTVVVRRESKDRCIVGAFFAETSLERMRALERLVNQVERDQHAAR